MIDDETMFELGDRLVPVDRRLGEIEHRAGALRRRRLLAATGSTLAIGLVIAGAAISPSLLRSDRNPDPAATPTVAPTPADDLRPPLDSRSVPYANICTQLSTPPDDQQGSAVRYLPQPGSGWSTIPDAVGIIRYLPWCEHPIRLVTWTGPPVDSSGGAGSFTVAPMERSPRSGAVSVSLPSYVETEDIRVGSENGTLWTVPLSDGHQREIYWKGSNGSFWFATAFGLTRNEIIAAAESVRFQHGSIDPRHAPPELTTPITRTAPVSINQATVELTTFVKRGSTLVALSIRHDPWASPPFTADDGRLVQVGGRPGVISSERPGPAAQLRVSIRWSLPGGVTATYSGENVSEDDLLALAEATVPVSATDPRIN